MTASATDTVTLRVPENERWLVCRLWMRNESTQTLTLGAHIEDESDNAIGMLFGVSSADNAEVHYPYVEGTLDVDSINYSPLIQYEVKIDGKDWVILAKSKVDLENKVKRLKELGKV